MADQNLPIAPAAAPGSAIAVAPALSPDAAAAAARRYDIDWLRVIAVFLLLIYHTTISFQPWGIYISFIQSSQPLELLWLPMAALNIWRIPLLFFVSGMALYLSMRGRSRGVDSGSGSKWGLFFGRRALRLMLPYMFGIFAIVPLQFLLFQAYYKQELTYLAHPSHLWYLNNVHIYGLLLALPAIWFMKQSRLTAALHRLMAALRRLLDRAPMSIYLFVLPFMAEAVFVPLISPDFNFSIYAFTLHGWVIGFIAFASGFVAVALGDSFRRALSRMKLPCLLIALGLYLLRLLLFELEGPNALVAVESLSWIFALIGFTTSLNRSSPLLCYLRPAVYPIYIIHMLFLYLGDYLLLPLKIPTWSQYLLILLFTLGGSLLFYELVRHIRFLCPLFGLRWKKK